MKRLPAAHPKDINDGDLLSTAKAFYRDKIIGKRLIFRMKK